MNQRRCKKQQGFGNIGPLVQNRAIYQKGGNFYPVYTPILYGNGFQCGAGIGSVFATLGRYLLPVIKQGFHAIKKRGLQTGIDLLNTIQEEPVKNYILNKSGDALSSLVEKGTAKLKNMKGEGLKKIKKRAKKAINKGKVSKIKQSLLAIRRSKLVKKKSRKRRSKDIFDSQ